MDFPRYVFTSPGKEKVKEGSYGIHLVQNEKEYEAALNAGFFSTMPEALEGAKDVKKEEVKSPEIKEKVNAAEPPKRGRPRSE